MKSYSRTPEQNYYAYRCPFGTLTIASNGHAITHIELGVHNFAGANKASALTNKTASEIQEYFWGKRSIFSVPIEPAGTEFQKRVWKALQDIPYGETRIASDIACALGDENAARTVGVAIKKNPIAIIIPSHRIIGANGRMPDATHAQRVSTAILKEEIKYRKQAEANASSQ